MPPANSSCVLSRDFVWLVTDAYAAATFGDDTRQSRRPIISWRILRAGNEQVNESQAYIRHEAILLHPHPQQNLNEGPGACSAS